MPTIPYTLAFEETVSADSEFEFSYSLDNNRTLEIIDMIITSAGVFDIIDIRNVNGERYSNTSRSNPIDGTHVKDAANENNHVNLFKHPATIKGGETFYLKVFDTSSAANLMNVTLICKLTKERSS